jgi:hypothetical protein
MKREDHIKKHGRSPRVLVSHFMLDIASDAFLSAIRKLAETDTDPLFRNHLESVARHLQALKNQSPFRPRAPRAPKGHATVPKALLLAGAAAIEEGAYEFEDAARYCSLEEDQTSCISKGTDMRRTANKLRRYAR